MPRESVFGRSNRWMKVATSLPPWTKLELKRARQGLSASHPDTKQIRDEIEQPIAAMEFLRREIGPTYGVTSEWPQREYLKKLLALGIVVGPPRGPYNWSIKGWAVGVNLARFQMIRAQAIEKYSDDELLAIARWLSSQMGRISELEKKKGTLQPTIGKQELHESIGPLPAQKEKEFQDSWALMQLCDFVRGPDGHQAAEILSNLTRQQFARCLVQAFGAVDRKRAPENLTNLADNIGLLRFEKTGCFSVLLDEALASRIVLEKWVTRPARVPADTSLDAISQLDSELRPSNEADDLTQLKWRVKVGDVIVSIMSASSGDAPESD